MESRAQFIDAIALVLHTAQNKEILGQGGEALELLRSAQEKIGTLIEQFPHLKDLPEPEPWSVFRFADTNGHVHWGPNIYRVSKSLAGKRLALVGRPSQGIEQIALAEPGPDYGRPVKFQSLGCRDTEDEAPEPQDRPGNLRASEDEETDRVE